MERFQQNQQYHKRTIKLAPALKFTATKMHLSLQLEMWANAQPDGRPAEYRWRPVLNAAKFGLRLLVECRAVTLPIGAVSYTHLTLPTIYSV